MKVIIVGGGFAGVNLALSLAHNIKFQVTLVDKNDYNLFSPFLYQVTSAFFKPSDISIPFLKLFSGKENLKFHLGEFEKIEPSENKIILNNGTLEYEYLILATGSFTDFSQYKNKPQTAFSMKTLDDAILMQKRLHQQIEKASVEKSEVERKKHLTFVVAGGGPGGVEISAMLAEVINGNLAKIKTQTSKQKSEIYLIQKDAVLLPFMNEKSQQDSYKYLSDLGVKIKRNTYVKDFSNDVVYLSSGEEIQTENLIWTVGVKAKRFEGFAPEVYGKDNRILVDDYNKVHGTYNIFAIGDTCYQTDNESFPDGYPQVAQVAIQQGKNLAMNFQLMAERQTLNKFRYKDQGTSVAIGRMKAVASLYNSRVYLSGKTAWLLWLFVHLSPMIVSGNLLRLYGRSIQGYFSKREY